MGVAEMWKAGRGHLVFVARTHLPLCSITLDHHHPRVCSSASRRCCHLSQVVWQSPGGILSQIQVGAVGKGQGVRHEGVGESSVRHREGPQDGAGWGSPIYVPAEEMVLHEHVLHPFLQWLLLLLLPLYWQFPVLREAEGKFAKDSQLTFDLHPARTAQE